MVEGILDPCPPYYEANNPKNAKHKPCTAPLRVNRNIGDEAARVLYGKNAWRISYKEDDNFWPEITYHPETTWRSRDIIAYVRHVVLSFDSRDVDHESIAAISRARFSQLPEPESDTFEGENDAEYIHQHREVQLEIAWIWKREILNSMRIKSIVLDFSNCFCPSGCCRMFHFLWDKYAFEECCSYWPEFFGYGL